MTPNGLRLATWNFQGETKTGFGAKEPAGNHSHRMGTVLTQGSRAPPQQQGSKKMTRHRVAAAESIPASEQSSAAVQQPPSFMINQDRTSTPSERHRIHRVLADVVRTREMRWPDQCGDPGGPKKKSRDLVAI